MNIYSVLLRSAWAIEESVAIKLLPLAERILSGESVNASGVVNQKTHSSVAASQGQNTVIIPIEGLILKDDLCGTGMKSLDGLLSRLDADPTVGSVILDIDSGGGEASYMPNISEAVRNFSKPIVAYYSGMMASAAYWLGSSCDAVFASTETDLVGSIGTFIELCVPNPDVPQQRKCVSVYATKSTEKNLEFREAVAGNLEPMRKNIVDPMNEAFHSGVKKNRAGIDPSVLTGRLVTSDKALALGMIDGIQSMEQTIAFVQQSNPQAMAWFSRKNKTKTNNSMKEYLTRVSEILGREVTSMEQLSDADFAAVTAAMSVQNDPPTPPEEKEAPEADATLDARIVAAVKAGIAPLQADIKTVSTRLETVEKEIQLPGADAIPPVNQSGDRPTAHSWEDPNSSWNQVAASEGLS